MQDDIVIPPTREGLSSSLCQQEEILLQEDLRPVWVYPKKDKELCEKIAREFHLHKVLAEVLVAREITASNDIHQHLYARFSDLYDPFLFADMPKAIDRIEKAIQSGEQILIYGDNDVDGMTGTALLTEFLTSCGAKVFYYVSSRTALLRQSMILDALEFALRNHCTLLITVDCGITAAKQIEEVVRHDIDVIITDHHEPTDKIPLCIATLNPKLLKSKYPNKELTGVGVAFKLISGLTQHLIQTGFFSQKKADLKKYLDLVAIGTVADMGQLVGENRILVKYGIQQLRESKRVGLAKLLAICEIDLSQATTSVIASKIAPRLNSLGRIAEPENGVKLLLIKNALAAEKLASELNLYNIERQKIERMMSRDVEKLLATTCKTQQDKAIILHSRKWHPGIIAILAMRIAKQYNRPTIMIAIEGQVGKGSVRSIPEFPVLPILKDLSEYLLNFGGHDVAAGLTIRENMIEAFASRFIQIANETLKQQHITPKLLLDAQVSFDELSFELMESLSLLEPYGQGNHAPVFYTIAQQVVPPKVVGKQHLRFYLQEKDRMLEAIGIGLINRLKELQEKNLSLKIAYTPQANGSTIHLLIKDFQIVQEN